MDSLSNAITWLNDPLNWTNPGGVLDLLGQHLYLSGLAVLLGCVVAWPVGVWLGATGRGGNATVVTSNVTRAVPTLALLSLFPLTSLGFGTWSVVIPLAVFAVPPLLATAYTGVRGVDADVREAAKGMGLSRAQVLFKVEVALAVPELASGFRTAAVQVVATTTLAALVNGGGLGVIINRGFGQTIAAGGGLILAGGILVAVLSLLVEGVLALAERVVTPKPLRVGSI